MKKFHDCGEGRACIGNFKVCLPKLTSRKAGVSCLAMHGKGIGWLFIHTKEMSTKFCPTIFLSLVYMYMPIHTCTHHTHTPLNL